MNISILLNDIASTQTDIDYHQLQAEIARRRQGEKLRKLGEILTKGLDADNFPLRLQLNKTHEVRVCDSIFDQFANFASCMTVCRTENLDQSTLMKLLEGIEE